MVTQEMIQFVKETIENADPIATQLAKKFPFRKRFDHCFRTYIWASRIISGQDFNVDIVEISSLFHDIGKPFHKSGDHSSLGAQITREYLKKKNYGNDLIEKISFCIENHSRSYDEIKALENKELWALHDADMLDEIGVLTLLWDTMDEGTQEYQSYEKTLIRIINSYKNLKDSENHFLTESGKRFFNERLCFLELIINNLEFELGTNEYSRLLFG